MSQNILAVGVESHAPQPHARHQLLRVLELPIPAEDGVDKLRPAVLAHLHVALVRARLLRRLPHVVLAFLQQLAEALPQPLATLQEILDHLPVLDRAHPRHALLGALDFARQLDEKQPHFAGDFGHGRPGAVVKDGPVIDPFPERVGIEDRAEQHDWFFGRIPVFVRVPSWNPCAARIFFCSFAWRRCSGLRFWRRRTGAVG